MTKHVIILVFVSLLINVGYGQSIPYGNNPQVGKYVNVNGIRLYYEVYGSGPALVLLHGNGGSIRGRANMLPKLSETYKVIAVDSRCHGKSGCSKALSYEVMAADVNALLNQLQVDSAYVYGHSDGGIVGLIMGYTYPAKVKKLVVSGANLTPDDKALEPTLVQLMQYYTVLPDTIMQKHIRLMVEHPHISFDQLKNIKAPVMVVSGDRDAVLLEHSVSIFKAIPKSNLMVLPATSHYVSDERPEELLNSLNEFFLKPFSKPSTVEFALKKASNMGLTQPNNSSTPQSKPNPNQAACNCTETFEKVVKKVEENYIGYTLIKKEIEADYANHIKRYRAMTSSASEESCTQLLQGFLKFFKDGHLFMYEVPAYSDQRLADFKSTLREKLIDVNSVYDYLLKNKTQLIPIEGIWTDGSARLAVIKNQDKRWPFQYVGVILSHAQTEKAGEVKFGLNFANNLFEGTYYTSQYAPRYVSAETLKDYSLLSLWGGIVLGRLNVDDRKATENAVLVNPLQPTLKNINNETLLLTIPSFLIDKKLLDEALKVGRDQLRDSKNLIIDIRGNGGGNAIYSDLLKWYAEKESEAVMGLALSSPDNIAYFERFSGGKKGGLYGTVVSDMQKMPGKIVNGPQYESRSVSTEKTKIEKVVILTDRSDASAAEQFIIHSKQVSSKVITMGQNTEGMIDYQSVNMVNLNCGERGIHFGYPTSTSHTKIPLDGYNTTGIKPDVSTEKTGEDLIAFALAYLTK